MWSPQYVLRPISSVNAWSGQASRTHVSHFDKTSGAHAAHATKSQKEHVRWHASHERCPRLHRYAISVCVLQLSHEGRFVSRFTASNSSPISLAVRAFDRRTRIVVVGIRIVRTFTRRASTLRAYLRFASSALRSRSAR